MQEIWNNQRRMSEEEILLSKGRMQEEYVQCKSRLAVLEAEARRMAAFLEKICAFLRSGGKQEPFTTGGLEEVLSGKVITLMCDLHDTSQRSQVLHKSLTDMGLDLKS